MSWVTVIWSMVASACLTLAAIRLMVWLKKRRAWANLAFSLLALGTAAMAAGELRLMRSETAAQYATTVRWLHIPYWVAILSLVLFTRLYLRAGRAWLAWTVCALRTLVLPINFLVGANINYREVTGLRPIPFLGESVSIAEGVTNPWMLLAQLALVLLAVFIADAAVSVWRRGDRRLALTVGGSLLFFILAAPVLNVLIFWLKIPVPVMHSIFYLGVVVAMGYDITRDMVRAGQLADDLRQSEARYRNIFERSIEGIYRVSWDGKVLFANPTTAKILGYDSAEDFIRTVTDVPRQVWANPEDRSRGISLIEKEGALRNYECRFKRKNGTLLWVSLNTTCVRGPDGRIAFFDGFFVDIDERKRAYEALKRSEHFLAETARIGKVGGWEFDIDTKKQTWTAETYNIHEVDPGYEPTVQKGLGFYTPNSRPIIENAVQRAIENGVPFELELEMVTGKGHHRDVRVIGRADLTQRRVYVFIQDISVRRLNEREMAELRLERTHLARVLTANEISSSLAHEINQPLGAILNNAETAKILLSQAQKGREAIPEIVDDIIQDAKRAGDVVRKVRSILRKGDVKFELLAVNALIDGALEILQNNLALNNVKLQLDVKPDLKDVRGDRVRLQQVLLNLMTNALDAMKEVPSRILTVRSTMDVPDTIIISVADSGPGIPEAKREMVFEPFYTTKKDGLGLGLPICRSIIEEHGGRIWAESNPGGGAIFSFSLKAWKES